MNKTSRSETPLTATFKIKLNGETIAITTVGQAYDFITNLNSVEWMEFRSLHDDAVTALENAADKAILRVTCDQCAARAVRSRQASLKQAIEAANDTMVEHGLSFANAIVQLPRPPRPQL